MKPWKARLYYRLINYLARRALQGTGAVGSRFYRHGLLGRLEVSICFRDTRLPDAYSREELYRMLKVIRKNEAAQGWTCPEPLDHLSEEPSHHTHIARIVRLEYQRQMFHGATPGSDDYRMAIERWLKLCVEPQPEQGGRRQTRPPEEFTFAVWCWACAEGVFTPGKCVIDAQFHEKHSDHHYMFHRIDKPEITVALPPHL